MSLGKSGGGGMRIEHSGIHRMAWEFNCMVGKNMHKRKEGKHHLGVLLGSPEETCGSCVWSRLRGPGPKVLRCTAAANVRVEAGWQACIGWEGSLDCLSCAACCGPAYDVVEVSMRDPVRQKQPGWVIQVDGRYQMKRRKDNHCQALGTGNKCQIYKDRPICCRDFEMSGVNCIFARRRLGLSKPWRIS